MAVHRDGQISQGTIKAFESKENAERYKSQITLAKRRARAFETADRLLENGLEKDIRDA